MHGATMAKRLVIVSVLASLIAAACTAGATPAPTGPFKLHLQLTPSHVSVEIAKDKGYYTGIDLETQLVGYGESSQLFHAGSDPIGNESAWEASVYQEQGKDIRFFSLAEASNFISGIIIRTEDKAKYPDLKSLKGQKIGMPGFGAAVEMVAGGISHHVEDEENEAFPKLRKSLGLRGSSSSSGEPTKEELYEQAKEAGIEGRSSMSKAELADAIEKS